ncbi:MAG: HAD-IIIA family hydrolase [Ruminococcus sp.]|nr:HAD-IIIA family hydrolase [Ruminococcus sp.]MDY3896163.1 HAD-IIIA family hydrolase [Candidatus Fimenecus sp.]
MKNSVIFDLDGTLLNSLDDLADSTNYTLRTEGYPERTRDEVRRFVGNGIYKLIERAVPMGTDKAEIDKCFDIFCRNYKKNMANKTKPYPGITDMLKTLYENGFKLAIVTNKADFAAQELCGEMFGDYVKTVVGSVKERRNKPFPDNVLFAMEKMGSEKSETVYVGDSEVDVETARNSGLSMIAVLWGYRDREVLEKAGAEKTAKDAEELKKMLLNLKK